MFEFIRRSLKMAGNKKGRLGAGMFFMFLENFSVLLNFSAIYFSFLWLNDMTSQRFYIIIGILVGSFLFHFLTAWLDSIFTGGVYFHIYKDYRLKVGEKLKKSPMGYFSEKSLSKILSCFTNILKSLENLSQLTLTFTIGGLSTTVFLLLGLFIMNVKMGILTLILSAMAWLIVFILFSLSKKYVEDIHKAGARYTDALIDGIRGIPVLRSFPSLADSKVKEIHSSIYDTSEEYRRQQSDFEVKVFVVWSRILGTFLNVSSLIAIVFSCYLYTIEDVTLAEALTLSVSGFLLFGGLKQLENAAILLVKNPSDLDYLEKILDIPKIEEGSIDNVAGKKDIEFENVNFSYTSDRQIIKNLNFKITEGSKVAIVGHSGSGKTTIINLLSRFYDVDSGAIKIADNNINDYKVDTLLKNLSLVFQDVYLFSDTVKNNIRFAKPNATDEEIIEVAKKAMCYDFIMAMPNGFDTMIGEGGSNISGGEKQRISIARALLKDAPIILLDEATSSVDPENEYEILNAIDKLCEGKTVVSIAHRLSTVKNADQILVIDDGELVQSGTHKELLAKGGIYADFIDAREKAGKWKL